MRGATCSKARSAPSTIPVQPCSGPSELDLLTAASDARQLMGLALAIEDLVEDIEVQPSNPGFAMMAKKDFLILDAVAIAARHLADRLTGDLERLAAKC